MAEDIRIGIRLGAESDAPRIAAFNGSVARETEGREIPADLLLEGVVNLIRRPQYGFYLVAAIADRIVASLMVTTEWSDWSNGFYWWLQSVYVVPEMRGRGILRLMYEHVGTMAAAGGDVRGLRLYVDRENDTAIGAYRRLGMQETEYRIFEDIHD